MKVYWQPVAGNEVVSSADERKSAGLMPIEIDTSDPDTSPHAPSDIFYWCKGGDAGSVSKWAEAESHQYRLRSKFYEVVADPYNPSFAIRVQAVRDQIDNLIAKYGISKSDIFKTPGS
jgi:hypothetical protein|tara:strand:+ start:232 stop:585 length:354 start_codon:yes stop_codon:yes gene_type:complete